jgi:hypothetical protein
MKLTDDFVQCVPLADSKAGRKYSDGKAMYLHVNDVGKYWRMSYAYAGKRKTLALGVYPAVSLEQARSMASSARELLSGGVDPGETKKGDQASAAAGGAGTQTATPRCSASGCCAPRLVGLC